MSVPARPSKRMRSGNRSLKACDSCKDRKLKVSTLSTLAPMETDTKSATTKCQVVVTARNLVEVRKCPRHDPSDD